MIFLSYAREDAPHAKRLQAELSNEGMHCVRDITLVEGDPFWRGKIRRQLDRCRVMIALDSKWAALSPWVEQERRAFAGPILTMA